MDYFYASRLSREERIAYFDEVVLPKLRSKGYCVRRFQRKHEYIFCTPIGDIVVHSNTNKIFSFKTRKHYIFAVEWIEHYLLRTKTKKAVV